MAEVVRRAFIAMLLGLLAATTLAAQTLPYTVVDDTGRSVTFARAPQRVVTLLPSLTETVCVLGACDRLLGTDRYSNWPTTVKNLPKLGGGLDPNVESVLGLRPDLVLVSRSSPAVQRLRDVGLRVLAFDANNRAEQVLVMRKVAQSLGLSLQQLQPVLDRIEQSVQQAAARVPASQRGRSVYFEVSASPHAAGQASFIGELLQALGLRNIVAADMGPFPKLNPEWVLRQAPQIIMVSEANWPALRARPGWASSSTMQKALGQACVYKAKEHDILVRPGPRLDEAVALILRCLDSQNRHKL
jgi:iron complex transport system substrate-binding protein